MKRLKYLPKVSVSLINFALIIITLIPIFARTKVDLKKSAFLGLLPNFYQHISNFSLSYLLVAGIGYIWLLIGIDLKYVIRFGLAVLVGNFVYELWIPLLNIPDIIDAFYGFWGTFLALVYLIVIKKYGLIANPLAS